MFRPEDWAAKRNGDIRYIGQGEMGTVLELHRWLIDHCDDMCCRKGDPCELDITSPTPSLRYTNNYIELINGFNIDDHAASHLCGGTIKQTVDGVAVYYADQVDVFGDIKFKEEAQVVTGLGKRMIP